MSQFAANTTVSRFEKGKTAFFSKAMSAETREFEGARFHFYTDESYRTCNENPSYYLGVNFDAPDDPN